MVFRRVTIRTNILNYFFLIVVAVAMTLVGTQYYFSLQIAQEAVDRSFFQTAEKMTLNIKSRNLLAKGELYKTVGQLLQEKAYSPATHAQLKIELFTSILKKNRNVYSIYVSSPGGDLFQVVNMAESSSLYEIFEAPAATVWTVISIHDGQKGRVRDLTFLDETLQPLARRSAPSHYFANQRRWYREAVESDGVTRSDPYLFDSLKATGITFATRINNENYVLGMDLTMAALHSILKNNIFSATNELFIFGRDGSIIVSSATVFPNSRSELANILKNGEIGRTITRQINGQTCFVMVSSLSTEFGAETYLGIIVSEAEMLRPYMEKIYYSLAFALLAILLAVPLVFDASSRIVRPVKRLMDENRKIGERRFSDVREIETNIVELLALSKSQVMMATSIREYQDNQKELMSSFIKLIANAIDAKSAYTGSHCKRVPIIATMLARQAEACQSGSLKDFRFESADAWEEFERGAWLHDCGKITTPEYVVDKATKLETIHNRIHEIRTRFEVLWRDLDIAYYEKRLAGEEKSFLDSWRQQQQHQLQDDFNFIASCNLGDEFMTPERKERLSSIAQRQWLRHFDDRIGLSEDELERRSHVPVSPLPAVETLITDRPEHIVPRTNFDYAAYRAEGFKLEPPEHIYNFGELYNLSIERGTLTREERFKINEHAIMTLRMLRELPYAAEMAKIPDIAGSHHEMLNGHGYPRRLTRDQLPIPTRIVAVADIFEALTASDRPYKKPKTLSETLKIMSFMVKDEHIDRELFELFLRSGVYIRYAEKYLLPEQLDDVDIELYLG